MYPYIVVGSGKIYSYSIFAGTGIAISIILVSNLLAERLLLKKYINRMMFSMVGMLICAKKFGIVSTIVYEYGLHGTFDLRDCVRNSGIVFWGGLIGFVLSMKLLCRKERSLREVGNILAIAIPLFHCFGRVGCYFAGCCYGKESNSIWALPYRMSFEEKWSRRLPVQLWEAGFELLLFGGHLIIYKRKVKEGCWDDGKLLVNYLGVYSLWRFVIEFFRGDVERGRVGILSFSQMVCVVVVGMMGINGIRRNGGRRNE